MTSCFEQCSYEVVKVGVDGVVSVIAALYIVPDMGHTVLCEAVVISAGDIVYGLVVAACGDEQEMGLLAALPAEAAGYSRCRADSSHIAEEIGALKSDEK